MFKRRVAANLLNLFQELAGLAMARIEVEGEQCEALGGDEVPASILLRDKPEMEAGNLPSHLAQTGSFGVHVTAQRVDGGLLISVHALPVRDVPDGLGQAVFQALELVPARPEVGFELLVFLLHLTSNAIRLANDPAVEPRYHGYRHGSDARELGNRHQPGILILKSGKPFP